MAAGVASSTRYYTLPYCYVRLHKAAVDQSTVYVDKEELIVDDIPIFVRAF